MVMTPVTSVPEEVGTNVLWYASPLLKTYQLARSQLPTEWFHRRTGCKTAAPLVGSIPFQRKMVCPWFVAGASGTVQVAVNQEMGESVVFVQDAIPSLPVCRCATASDEVSVAALRTGI